MGDLGTAALLACVLPASRLGRGERGAARARERDGAAVHFAHEARRTVRAAVREGLEELGVAIELDRYLVRADAVFRFADQAVPWATHVFSASTEADVLAPQDTAEIAEARWGTAAQLAGPIRERLLATGRALWRYRVALHDAALSELDG